MSAVYFKSHDPYHPYHHYLSLDSSVIIGKDRKDGRDGVVQSLPVEVCQVEILKNG
ncbi:MAG: hypothetical protein WAK17_20925 [Candidatus Nitrosopolaris sp.]